MLAGPAAGVRLARRRHLAVVVCAEPPRRRAAALTSKYGGRRHALLLDDIVGQGECRAKILAAMSRPILRKVWDGFKGKVRIGDQVSEG